jgi:putative redox protein
MRLILADEHRIQLKALDDPEFELEAVGGVSFSPLHMLAGSLGTCTAAVLTGWARQAELGTSGLELQVTWDYVDDPYRVGRFEVDIHWPELPEERRAAALRAAEHCTVEQTLRHPPRIETRVSG